ncbi:hypothetical protein L3Q82_021409 [Scortum barcoo]|uniref:Uncharacterized protein n=1 Tax=Scortum barcoo TaxID=214431 RepID=A0ACB8X4K6_9TELE|nr:hypothetical protein L3Q82_021409 [Scortum barcoo]
MAGPRPVVFSGPSGAGKSTLLKKLMKEYDNVFGFSVSHTTRNPRLGEENGKDYHFVSREEMQAGIDNGEFIENAEFSGNMYGTSKAAVQDVQARNLICILDIDMQGVRNIKTTDLNPIYISIQPPSMDILVRTQGDGNGYTAHTSSCSCFAADIILYHRDRKTESEESLQKRLQAAMVDMEFTMAGPRPVVIFGPSGVGKTTVVKKLMKEYDKVFGLNVSYTTRNPRLEEVNGKDYNFVSREEMQAGIDNGEFIEHAEFSGNMYGTKKAAVQNVQARNLICILILERQGVRSIKVTDLNPIYIAIQPPSMDILEKRLRDRKTESEESLQKRLQAAKVDMEFSKEPGLFDATIINDNLEDAYGQLKQLLLEVSLSAEHIS